MQRNEVYLEVLWLNSIPTRDSIYNGNTLITPLTKALEFYAKCGMKDQGLTFLMVNKTLFYVSYLLRYRLLKQAHIYTLNTFHPH